MMILYGAALVQKETEDGKSVYRVLPLPGQAHPLGVELYAPNGQGFVFKSFHSAVFRAAERNSETVPQLGYSLVVAAVDEKLLAV